MRFNIVGAALGLAVTTAAFAGNPVYFNSFSNTSNLVLNGYATAPVTDGSEANVLRLVSASGGESGTAWSKTPLTASTGFSSVFQFRMTNPSGITDYDGYPGGDGFTFCIQSNDSGAGTTGNGLGYSGIGKSVAVKFDTWRNGPGWLNDPSSNYIGVATNGDVQNADFPGGQANVTPAFDNGDLWTAWVDYNGSTLNVYAADKSTVKPGTPTLSYALGNIATELGGSTGYVGFTASTGQAYENDYIVNWSYYDNYNPGAPVVPEPASLGLLGAGTLGLLSRRRKV